MNTNYNRRLIGLACCFCLLFCSKAFAEIETKILGFGQATFLSADQPHLLTMRLYDVNPVLPMWFSVYYIGAADHVSLQPIADERYSAVNSLELESEQLILQPNPYLLSIDTTYAPARKKYSLTEYGDVVDLIEDNLDEKVKDVFLPEHIPKEDVRVYSTVLEFTQDIHSNGTVSLDISNVNMRGMRPLGLYVIAGQGDKPQALTDLTTRSEQQIKDAVPPKRFGIIDPVTKLLIMIVIFGVLVYLKKS